jgi:hypothetical protein
LSLKDALLLNTGKLTVSQRLDLNGGYFFNAGVVKTSADPSVFGHMTYMFNGSMGTIDATGRLVMSATNFSNLGDIKAKSMSVVTSELLDNRGRIETTAGFEAEGFGTVFNNGVIDGKSGNVSVSGAKFEHRQGRISGSRVEFGSEATVLVGAVAGQEGYFHGNVVNSGSLDFKRAVIDGLFINSSGAVKFEQKLDLTGRRAEI